ncbi:PREDICTED: uncharacterized protein LOC108770657 [Trachymyrmex cornetzi]|uniref:uncharacterized protein LOC108770657 n=1 Tax=Trachymyrmex cornetzi TaxID=471704 RepID=UPI00084EE569|nr:PREDICTED: uncharacterized protein LOC108770657 [Trachymyrmex cornetzi]
MIRFKGRNSIKQYLPMKPIKRGYKVWVRADKYGYVCEFQIYTRKANDKSEKFLGERKKEKEMSVGDSEFRSSYNGVSWLKWIDKKPVHFLSNFHDASKISQANRRQKDGSLKEVTCPQICVDYNAFMGCVDKADMLKSYYEINRKSKKWWQRIFWHFVDVTLVNSFIWRHW